MPSLSTRDRAAMELDQVLGDRQAEAEATARPLQRLLALDEALEDVRRELRRDADALVVDAQDGAVAVAAELDRDPLLGARELGRVGDQVADHLGQPHRIAVDPDRGARALHLGRPAALAQHRLGELERARDHVAQVDAPAAQPDLSRRDARDVEQVVDHAREVRDLALDDAALAFVDRVPRDAP